MARRLSVCLLVLVLAGAAHAAAQTQWLPGESWPGGKQYDPRLDQPVHLWVTARPLAQVFAALTKQTGVTLGFFPVGDDNERVCVNLYLNPQQPPALRDLLAQLSWAVDCSFTTIGEGDQRQYVLLRTSAGSGALAEWERWRDQASVARQRKRQQVEGDLWRQTLARLPEVRQALALGREEAIRRYSGDPLLLTLLDPPRRAVARFMLSLPEGKLAQMQPDEGEETEWGALTPEQQEWLKEAFQPAVAEHVVQQAREPAAAFPWHDWPEAVRLGLRLIYWVGPTGLRVELWPAMSWEEAQAKGWSPEGATATPAILVADPREQYGMRSYEAVALRRLLGETLSDEQATRMTHAADEARWNAELRAAMDEQLAQYRHVSAEAMARLSAVTLPVEANDPYALWQLQEAVAVQSGFTVVSDSMWQPPRTFLLGRQLLFPDATKTDAFSVLTSACVTNTDPVGAWVSTPERTACEWGDAGNILRFRSVDRALWREAILPRAVLDTLDQWLAPSLPDSPIVSGEPPPITVPLDLRQYAPLVASLIRAQLMLGADLNYGDPTNLATVYRQAFRSQLLQSAARVPCRIIAALDDQRWEQLRTEGLLWEREIHIELNPVDREIGWYAFEDGDLFRLEEPPANPGAPASVTRWARLYASRPGYKEQYGCDPFDDHLPLGLILRPSLPKHLISAPG